MTTNGDAPARRLEDGLTGTALHPRRTAVRQWRVACRRSRRLRGVVEGARYRLAGRGPDLLAGDDVLADRVRSTLGPIEKRLDVPRVHVMVTNHVVTLHGEVGTVAEALSLTWAAGAVPGVMAVRCQLHVGLLPGQGRPSQGRLRRRAPSEPLGVLLDAARASVGAEQAPTAVRAVVEAFAACLPACERGRLYAGLPGDLRRLAIPRHRCRWTDRPADLVSCVAEVSGLGDLIRAERLTVAVLGAMSDILQPADAARVGEALPPALRPLWQLPRHQDHPTGARRRVWRQVCRGEWQWTLTPNGSNPTPAHHHGQEGDRHAAHGR
jgi:uncharacterized protein (DUF2267 family)